MKKIIMALVSLLAFSACSSNAALQDSYYLVDKITVSFTQDDTGNAKDEGSDFFRDLAKKEVEGLKDNIYFYFNADTVAIYQQVKPETAKIENKRFKVKDNWMTITAQSKGSLTLTSDKDATCGMSYCTVVMVLHPADKNSLALLQLQQRFDKWQKKFDARLKRENETFTSLMAKPFTGTVVALNNDYNVKLPAGIDESLSRWESGVYSRKLGGLYINWKNEGNEIYSFNNAQQSIRGEFIVVPGNKTDFNLAEWLAAQKGVIYQSAQGAAYYNQQGMAEALFFRYDDTAGRYVIGVGDGDSLASLAQALQILMTIEPEHQ